MSLEQARDGEWFEVAGAASLAEGQACGAVLAGHRIAVYRRAGEWHATDGLCTHAWVPLEDGLLDGYEIECPVHQARFDIRSGACVAFPAQRPLRTYAVRQRDGRVEVFVPSGLEIVRGAPQRRRSP